MKRIRLILGLVIFAASGFIAYDGYIDGKSIPAKLEYSASILAEMVTGQSGTFDQVRRESNFKMLGGTLGLVVGILLIFTGLPKSGAK